MARPQVAIDAPENFEDALYMYQEAHRLMDEQMEVIKRIGRPNTHVKKRDLKKLKRLGIRYWARLLAVYRSEFSAAVISCVGKNKE